MKLYLLKRDHHEGQDIYGVYDSESNALEQIQQLREWMPNVPRGDYQVKEVELNELTEIVAYE